MYINVTCNVFKLVKYIMFADDTNVSVTYSNLRIGLLYAANITIMVLC